MTKSERNQESLIRQTLAEQGIDATECRLDRMRYFRPKLFDHLIRVEQSRYVSRSLMPEVKLSDEAARAILSYGGRPLRHVEAAELRRYSRPVEGPPEYPCVLRRPPAGELPPLTDLPEPPAKPEPVAESKPPEAKPEAPPAVPVIDLQRLTDLLAAKLSVLQQRPQPAEQQFDIIPVRDPETREIVRYRRVPAR